MIRILQIFLGAARPAHNARTAGLLLVLLLTGGAQLHAACSGCTTFNKGVVWGTTTYSSLGEASGLAFSARNPGVLWSHNDDGNDGRLFAFRTNGAGLARFQMNLPLRDVEDMAVGPGPISGVSYLYIGDIGGGLSGSRDEVRVVRIPEPAVSLAWASNPVNLNFTGVQVFTLKYPTQPFSFTPFWDAETLMVDPLDGDVYVGTKFNNGTYLYRANLNSAVPGSTNFLEFVRTVGFNDASGGTISADGRQIILRNEDTAKIWFRCSGETIATALGRAGQTIPVIGTPTEPNGEAVAFLPNGRGYVTVSDSVDQPPLYFFSATCPPPPETQITQSPHSVDVAVGTDVQLTVAATGEDLAYQWFFNSVPLPGETATMLELTSIQPARAGAYTVRVSGAGGTETAGPANVTVRVLPPTIFTQPQNTLAATGVTVQLSVAVEGTAPFNYIWRKAQRTLPPNSATLTLTNVTKASSGSYRVMVANSAGSATSAAAKLTVLIPPTLALQPQPKTVLTGKTAILRARATGSPKLAYQWLFNGGVITNATKPQLTLLRVQSAQAGNYSVVVTNAVGIVTSVTAVLTVQ